jgi:imidazolonepropionase-like amidohydrolase
MRHMRTLVIAAAILLSPCALAQNVRNGSFVHGVFRLHVEEQAVGAETYDVMRDGGGFKVSMQFTYSDRGRAVPLSAVFRTRRDWTPAAFEVKGSTSRDSTIDQAVEIRPEKLRIRSRSEWKEVAVPKRFFTIAGYAPITMQMLLVRYWLAHGSPKHLSIFPGGGHVEITARGRDFFTVGGLRIALDRYMVEGLIWGHESLWLNSHGDLVAAVTLSAELSHFEAIREGYEEVLGRFVGLAGKDGMSALTELSSHASVASADTIAIVGGTLIDGNGGAPVPDTAIVVRGERIVAVGREPEVTIPRAAYRVDARGKTVLPGLWDVHAHFEQVEWGPIYLAAGVTTVRDCGNEFEFITAVRDAIRDRRGIGPRLLLAGVVDGTSPDAAGVQRVDTPEQARLWTHRYHDAGFQQMKIYSSVKLEEEKVVIEEAHRLGMSVTGHVPDGLNAYQTVEVGQDQINHITYIADIMHTLLPQNADRAAHRQATLMIDLDSAEAKKAIEFLKAHGTVLDPTIATFEIETATTDKPVASIEPGAAYVAPQLVQILTDVGPPTDATNLQEKLVDKYLAIVGALHRAAIPIMAGTDQTIPGHSLHRELELYVKAGFTPMEAIQAAAQVPARALGFDKDVGTVEAGKRADLIVIKGDPLADIRNTRNVEAVIANGQLYSPSALWRSVGFRPWMKE